MADKLIPDPTDCRKTLVKNPPFKESIDSGLIANCCCYLMRTKLYQTHKHIIHILNSHPELPFSLQVKILDDPFAQFDSDENSVHYEL